MDVWFGNVLSRARISQPQATGTGHDGTCPGLEEEEMCCMERVIED